MTNVEEPLSVADAGLQAYSPDEPDVSPNCAQDKVTNGQDKQGITANSAVKDVRRITRKELFDELYGKYIDLPKRERALRIMYEMEQYFDSTEQLKWYVDLGFERKQRNLIARRIRMTRKANLAQFNYFCTFTYDDKKHTEET